MDYFVTGGTGFLGRFLVEKLLQRGGNVYVLVRPTSRERYNALARRLGSPIGLNPVFGDLEKPDLGLTPQTIANLKNQIDHFFHAAAIYDIAADAQAQHVANVLGTRNAINCAQTLVAGCFHHISSIAAGGLFRGTFREDMFHEAENLDNPYFLTKHESEGLVRNECTIPYRIYRPASIVGHSGTGEIDKIDGPYYSFTAIRKMRDLLPPWFPLASVDSGSINVVPVDYVADAIDYIAHKEGCDGGCFHLVNPRQYSFGEMFNIFAAAAHAPRMAMRFDSSVFRFLPSGLLSMAAKLPPVKRMIAAICDSLGMPVEALGMMKWSTRYDARETERALQDSGISLPPLEDYAANLWDYWARNLDPNLFVDRSLAGNVAGKRVVITGAGSGIGAAVAERLALAGAEVIITGRTLEKLEETRDQILAKGAKIHVYATDNADMEACDSFIKQVLIEHGTVDILINNAGRSIRRSIELSYDRFHDFQRTMQINYFGALRLTLGFLPGMSVQRNGQIINISSMGVIGPPPRFSAYVASKSALEGFTRVAEAEFLDRNIAFTNINMPLVRTPMIGPTAAYDFVPALTPGEAAEMIVEAIIDRPSRITTPMGKWMQVAGTFLPKALAHGMNASFRMFDDSNAAKGIEGKDKVDPTSEQVALAALMKGVHF
ncbi:SDR family oxidoreductase [Parahaliea mediterranea]|uniref:SDR family oxidoreductase n=1 Tax=Parahaliea mediterranea TaxID=651086 RepID=UPI000E2E7909|nr:SDR family oxidoreductase [Parahaliea mediterranea]